jgi:hypothetical protein
MKPEVVPSIHVDLARPGLHGLRQLQIIHRAGAMMSWRDGSVAVLDRGTHQFNNLDDSHSSKLL